jgi:hypothetical protein
MKMMNPQAQPHFQRYRLSAEQRATIDKAANSVPAARQETFRNGINRVLRASGAHGDVSSGLFHVVLKSQMRLAK